ncbi:MAG: topoisomerase DNA-binding C4 zinc finger domain-containing protein, partial [Nitrospinota bacterium]
TEAALIKELEDKGIGRPSTYASIMSTILNREYITLPERRLTPTKLGILISGLLLKSFPDILNVEFTAKMEEELDQIEEGQKEWVTSLKTFYKPFSDDLEKAEVEMENIKASVEETSEICEKCGNGMVIKWGRFGRFLACSNYPDCKNTKQIKEKENGEVTIEPEETTDEKCEKCGADMTIKRGRFGKFLACSAYPECKSTKPISLGINCPEKECNGAISEKRTKRGRVFYGCSRYPDCTFAEWSKPVNEECPDCGSLYLVEKKGRSVEPVWQCPKKECGYKKEASNG